MPGALQHWQRRFGCSFSVSWTVAALRMREHSLALLHAAFTAINLLGIYRWLIV